MTSNEGDDEAAGGRGASVLHNGIRVLRAFTVEEPVLGVTEIARRVDLHKSTVSRTLASLERFDLVERDPDTGRFRLGLGLIALSGPLLAHLDVRRVAYGPLEELTRRSGETSALMTWSGNEAVSVEQVPSPKQVKHTSPIGTRYTTAASSSVQVFLAELPEGEVRRLLERGLLEGRRTDEDIDRYLQRLSEVRKNHYAVNDGETSVEEIGISAPVRDHRDQAVAAVLLSAPRFRISRDLLDQLALDVRDTAAEISARLGARPGSPA